MQAKTVNPADTLDDVTAATNESYWTSRENNSRLKLGDESDLWDWLIGSDFNALAKWTLIPGGGNLFFRGQSDISYGLTSSLYRQVRHVKPDTTISEKDLGLPEAEMLKQMRKEGLGKNMTDFELVAVLQHHLMPTRLIDVSRSPMESLYFAVEDHHGTDGVMFLINPHQDSDLDFGGDKLPWDKYRTNKKYGDSRWTNTVNVAEHNSLDPRMTAQNGTFLLGGLFRAYSGVAIAGVHKIPVEMRTDLMTLAINFLITRQSKQSAQWGASGWVIRIPAEWKRPLLYRLKEELNISKDTIYPAYSEMSRLAKHVVNESAGRN